MKVEINFDNMTSKQMLSLARQCIKEHNDLSLDKFYLLKKVE